MQNHLEAEKRNKAKGTSKLKHRQRNKPSEDKTRASWEGSGGIAVKYGEREPVSSLPPGPARFSHHFYCMTALRYYLGA